MNYVYQDFIDNPELLDNLDKIVKLRCNHCNHEYDKERKHVRCDTLTKKAKNNYCGRECSRLRQITSITRPCAHCRTLVTKQPSSYANSKTGNVFCSNSCSNTYANLNRDPQIYVDHSIKMKSNTANTKNLLAMKIEREKKLREKYDINPKSCFVCETILQYDRRHNKICADQKCYSAISSINAKKAVAVRSLRSKDEIELYELCSDLVSECLSNHIISDGWDADIVLPEHKIAILWNGPWHYREMNIGNHSLKQVQNRDRIKTELFEKLGWKVMVFEDRHYTPQTAFETIKATLIS